MIFDFFYKLDMHNIKVKIYIYIDEIEYDLLINLGIIFLNLFSKSFFFWCYSCIYFVLNLFILFIYHNFKSYQKFF
mgnify:CR=1 FL=1